MHQVEGRERKKREEELRCSWRGPDWGYIVQMADGESGMGAVSKRHERVAIPEQVEATLQETSILRMNEPQAKNQKFEEFRR